MGKRSIREPLILQVVLDSVVNAENQLQFKIECFVYLLSGITIYSNKGKHAPFSAFIAGR
jgi:hypothetical protein